MATKKTQLAAEVVPVSAESNIQIHVFDQPVNGMLGTVVGFDTIKGKFVRYAHAYLIEDGPDMSIDGKVGGREMTFENIERITTILTLFSKTVKDFYANR